MQRLIVKLKDLQARRAVVEAAMRSSLTAKLNKLIGQATNDEVSLEFKNKIVDFEDFVSRELRAGADGMDFIAQKLLGLNEHFD